MNDISLPLRPRAEVCALPQVQHGAPDYAELAGLGMVPDDVLDFSVNSNPYGPSPAVARAIAQVRLDRYPDRACLALRRALSDHLRVSMAHIVAGNGTAELIWLIALAYLAPGRRVLIIGPTFGEYAHAAALMGAQVDFLNALPAQGFNLQMGRIGQEIEQRRPHVLFICNPNNPTGLLIPPPEIAACAARFPGTLFVVDEAYHAFVPTWEEGSITAAPNTLSLRSMTKDYALAGLRLGYAVGAPEVIQTLASVCPPWSVNALAQAAGLAALEDEAHLRTTLAALSQAKQEFLAALAHAHLKTVPSATHFFLAEVGDAAAFRHALMRHGIQVRDCASFGLPAFVRIATRRAEENARFIHALGDVNWKFAN
jgi:L-threonine-O-3-phosphate decarboxylase